MAVISGIIAQLSQGHTHFELGLYFKGLVGIDLLGYWHLAAVAVFIQTVANNKYLGFVLTGVYLVGLKISAA